MTGDHAALLWGDARLGLGPGHFGRWGRYLRFGGWFGFGWRWRRWDAQGTAHLFSVLFVGVHRQMQQSLNGGADAHTLCTAQPNPQVGADRDHLFGGASLAMNAQPSQSLLLSLCEVVGLQSNRSKTRDQATGWRDGSAGRGRGHCGDRIGGCLCGRCRWRRCGGGGRSRRGRNRRVGSRCGGWRGRLRTDVTWQRQAQGHPGQHKVGQAHGFLQMKDPW